MDANIHDGLKVISAILGWLYFICWSVAFYPQLIINFRRKSVTGLSIDFVIASFYGFLCYAISNACFYAVESVREEYRQRHHGNDNLVALNDVVFAIHATIMTFILNLQAYIYRKPNEGPSLGGVGLALAISAIIILGGTLAYFGLVPMLTFLYALSYTKLVLTIIKYIPQAWMNWMRHSTSGWSIMNVLLDFSGGIFSMTQLFLDAFLSGHLAGILGFITKLVLAIISILFDTIFMAQHYIWFPEPKTRPIALAEVIEATDTRPTVAESLKKEIA